MSFKNYVHASMLCEELVNTISEDKVELFAESVSLIEAELNELLGLNRLGDKLKTLSSKGDKAVEDAKYVAKNIAKDTIGKVADDAKEVYQSHKEIAQAAGKVVAGAFAKSQDAIKEIWGKATGNLSPEQTETVKDLEAIFKKMGSGKFLSGPESVKVLAAVLAGGTSKQIPSFKAYKKQLDRLQEVPGLSSVRLTVKSGKA